MTPVFQSCVDKDRGDCERAVIASLFDLELEQVPNFILFKRKWFEIYRHFLFGLGYGYKGTCHLSAVEYAGKSINGYFEAGIPSRTFPGVFHAVVMDEKGFVAHDPNPNKLCLGLNILDLDGTVMMIDKVPYDERI